MGFFWGVGVPGCHKGGGGLWVNQTCYVKRLVSTPYNHSPIVIQMFAISEDYIMVEAQPPLKDLFGRRLGNPEWRSRFLSQQATTWENATHIPMAVQPISVTIL